MKIFGLKIVFISLISLCFGSEVAIDGPCPQPQNTMHHRGEKLIPSKLNGIWKVIYDQEVRVRNMDCFTVKMDKNKPFLNETQL